MRVRSEVEAATWRILLLVAHQHLPTSSAGSRSRRRVVALEAQRPAVPPAPPGVDGRALEVWRELWRLDVAALWRDSDRALVARLCALRTRLEADAEAPASLYSAALAVENQLGLTPRSRRALGVDVAEAEPVARRPAKLSARERDRLLRG